MSETTLTPEERAQQDLMIHHLKAAVDAGFFLATPGSNDAVRATFPDFFADEPDADQARRLADEIDKENVSLDDHPLLSRADDGCWVSAWIWLENEKPA